ncbi:sialate O-acetylesterase [Gramella sp. AN32]|uniref:Sialate O-acetylesterase n=1 Tax=Christiangramia antarctica TaxID=2058158 RepID=A0ABW5X500_9FLAO|nr:sialate O-acetylesterase [Gramella sp. AN32]MCM4157258.1 9-O-acetylesterase [Gramella sp. AN32]
MSFLKKIVFGCCGIFFLSNPCKAEIKLPPLVGNHMVLQQNSEVNLWGWASPDEKIKIELGWEDEIINIVADANGNWKVQINTPTADNKSYQIKLTGEIAITLSDVKLGEVWICSGQSNMYFTLGKQGDSWKTGVMNYKEDVKAANYPNIRLFTVEVNASQTPEKDVEGSWQLCTPQNAYYFSAVAYYFGRSLYQDLKVPIGLISSSWGGTKAESWTSKDILQKNQNFLPILKRHAEKEKNYYDKLEQYYTSILSKSDFQKAVEKPSRWEENKDPYVLYNAMIHPLINYTIKGAIWYQGESNADRAYQYRTLFPAMIENWRDVWNQEDFPFYFVQIAPHRSQNPEIREAQLIAFKGMTNTGMVVTTDIGNPTDIHPRNKKTVGERLSYWALAKTYNKKDINFSGPIYDHFEKKGKKIQIFFNYAENGLKAEEKELSEFEIAGTDQKFYSAKAEIKKNTIIVSSEKVKDPVAVRFAWKASPNPNLYNSAGLPASPFRTDNWPGETYNKF